MIIAISSETKSIDGKVNPRFGRCSYFVIFDTETKQLDFIDNFNNSSQPGGAGIQAAELLSKFSVNALITGNCGPKAFRTLDAAEIAVYTCDELKISDAVERLEKDELTRLDNANVSGHWQ